MGPTAVNSLMSFNYAGGSPYKAVTLAFFSGLIEILAGILNLGFLIQYISGPVISAFSSAVSIQVVIKSLNKHARPPSFLTALVNKGGISLN